MLIIFLFQRDDLKMLNQCHILRPRLPLLVLVFIVLIENSNSFSPSALDAVAQKAMEWQQNYMPRVGFNLDLASFAGPRV